MGCEWVEHFVHVLCMADHVESWRFLQSYVVPKWSMLPSSWCINFALVFLFSTVQPRHTHSLPAYQCLVNAIWYRSTDGSTFFPFLETTLQLIESSLTLGRITSLESWLAKIPERPENHNIHTQLGHFLATKKQQKLAEETLGLLAELPKAHLWMDG